MNDGSKIIIGRGRKILLPLEIGHGGGSWEQQHCHPGQYVAPGIGETWTVIGNGRPLVIS